MVKPSDYKADTVELSTKKNCYRPVSLREMFTKEGMKRHLKRQAIATAVALGVLAAVTLTGKAIDYSKFRLTFNKPLVKRLPNAELDALADKILSNQKINYGFDDIVTSKTDFEGVLKKLFPDHFSDGYNRHGSYGIKPILESYDKNSNDTVEAVRLLTGKYYSDFKQENVLYMNVYNIGDLLEKADGKPNISAIEDFIKIGTISNYNSYGYKAKGFEEYMKNPAESKRLFAAFAGMDSEKPLYQTARSFIDILKRTKNPFAALAGMNSEKSAETGSTIFTNILDEAENYNPKNMREFLYSLKKGIAYKNEWKLEYLLKDKNFDPVIGKKFVDSLDDKVIRIMDMNSLEEILTKPDINAKQASEKLNAASENILKKLGRGGAITYLRFEEFLGKNNINELTMAEKKRLIEKLVKNNANTFTSGKKLCPLLPKNREEYCSLLQKLSKSIGIDTKPLSKAQAASFNEGLTKLASDIKDVDINKVDISLKVSPKDFAKQAENLMEGLSKEAKIQVMDYFGFEITDGKLKGYPINVNNGQKLSEIKDVRTKKVVEKLRPIVVEFSEHNPIQVSYGNKAVEKELNQVLEGLPELRSIIGKAQHQTHDFTLDKHTLKVFQNVVSDPRFENLSNEDKRVISIASLLHDITKAEGLRDQLHPTESAFDAYYIIQKFNLPEQDQLKIYELIRSHNWLDRLNNPKNKDIIENIAQDIAFDARHTNTFELAKILCEADLKSVKKDASFFNHHKKTLKQMSDKVDRYIKGIHSTEIILPQTRIPKASEITNGVVKSANGITNTVIYMDKADNDLSKYGFDKGTTKKNWKGLVHALDNEEQMGKFDTFSVIDTEALLSTSYMTPESYKVFRRQGLILDVNPNDIHAGYYKDFGTGYSKDIELLKADYLFEGQRNTNLGSNQWRGSRSEYRNYISQQIKKAAGLNDEEYIQKMEKIQGCKSITDIEKIDKDFADVLMNVFDNMEAGKRRGGRAYNEMLVTRPKIQGVFAYDQDYRHIPKFLRKYAEDNNLPIIIFGK